MTLLRVGKRVRFVLLSVAMGPVCLGQETETSWKLDAGLSFIATSGNSDTSSGGLSIDYERSFSVWGLEAGMSALQTTEEGNTVAEKYGVFGRGNRALSDRLSLTMGWRGEQNRFAGIDLRSVVDLGISWKAIQTPKWEMETSGSATWNHEDQVGLAGNADNIGLLLSAISAVKFSDSASTTQKVVVEPNLEDSDDYRVDVLITVESSLTGLLALRFGFNYHYDNDPVAGFEKTDTETTASLVVKLARGSYSE